MAYLWGKPRESPEGEPAQPGPQSPFQSATHVLRQVLTLEQRRTVFEFLVANAKAKEAAGMEPPALPNVSSEVEEGSGPADAVKLCQEMEE